MDQGLENNDGHRRFPSGRQRQDEWEHDSTVFLPAARRSAQACVDQAGSGVIQCL